MREEPVTKKIKLSPPARSKEDKRNLRQQPTRIEYSEEESTDESDINDDDNASIGELSPSDKVTFFPETVDNLRARFEELLQNIAINRKSGEPEKTGDRNEAVFLLDELKRQGGISRRMYQRYNDFLTESLPVEFGIDVESGDEDLGGYF